jgi:hypothetical protein
MWISGFGRTTADFGPLVFTALVEADPRFCATALIGQPSPPAPRRSEG